MSLQMDVVPVEKPQLQHARSHSKSDNLSAKHKTHSNVNPHDRIKNDKVNQSLKRKRNIGGTPPSATQSNKKALGNPVSGDGGSNRNLTKNQKKKEKERLKKLLKDGNNSITTSQTAENQAKADKSVLPLHEEGESSGSNESAGAGSQQTAKSSTNDMGKHACSASIGRSHKWFTS